ncbi:MULTISPECIES: F0F1 ATP synthase subunit epsilon [unclassified Granulicatella]|uniref:F0F1 ATP synthase subunit epsilon n=1 Tax=unclassified Granulicatella TaxID=2630493 RepID=UPI0010732B55|nr:MULTISPECIES: F0F1 ATP synthase subunit epsilon [unclassified Granulicatella]MBF0780852.1 F0F1 ATP synthase subunit epsilon [Granulicatella sp. 19428wC4_WM01]TFU93490.1 F0F1 ATP synthase subunit epsilon [Granulicatella sp. WM01]
MDEKGIIVNIVTPEGIVYSHHAKKVSVKTEQGGLTILPNHIPIVTPLVIGPVTVTRQSVEQDNYIAVNAGILEFSNNVCNIIADSAERARDIDRDRANFAKERAEHEIHEAEELHDDMRLRRARISLNKAINRIGVCDLYRK